MLLQHIILFAIAVIETIGLGMKVNEYETATKKEPGTILLALIIVVAFWWAVLTI